MDDVLLALPLIAILAQYLVVASRAITKPSTSFNFSAQSDTDCVYKFRFTKQQIVELVRSLYLPDGIITTHRYKADPLEAICIMLSRLALPHRLGSMVETFGRSSEASSAISNHVMMHVYERLLPSLARVGQSST
ncbi:hypothetical protein SDRG_13322 [Saprolegnia diclina VS20]|uniref:Uncharacterized protein n=1 Tax=Saprolegnia diclina (strain VS20) TaxID=1156394 RepID=T0Q6C4_SAPDV|nr:hypothetical protein SDRG_13322 [Saprolegnia diclina VS20]EQC28985.1 hypothetical protein SDRG_13322 [Saprolegnia diclina VS20]|eukprot:XP_008617624.1 hypothetical protein SDRG_13322 [Saprolegnia diclina VS20]